ncbi:hypothetical protein [Methylosinus sp. Ce-a6]|uniref:hypothetical protein n=1 Tax=Methylosinus sp. Ce-a6 TaxID=2172005 RepID=UPI001915755F|nr:hypothetical protein [Methylosinus sp. Ce-a6]
MFYDGVPDSVDISAQHSRKLLHKAHPGMLRLMKPVIELIRIFAAQNASEAHRELAQDDEAGRGALQNDDLGVLGGR